MHRDGWEETAMKLAESIAASRSEHPNDDEKVGACAVGFNREQLYLGYNNPPPGISIDWSSPDRKTHVIHAEVNSLRYAKPGEIDFIAVTLSPCINCLITIASYRIKKVYYRRKYDKDDKAFETAKSLGIELIQLS